MAASDEIQVVDFRPEFTDELVPMWRESFEDGVGIVDWHPLEEQRQFFLTDVGVAMTGDTALVTCTENILSGGPAEEGSSLGPLVGQLVVATNVFRRTPDGWKLWSHHGSPVLAETGEEEDEEPTV